MLSSTQITKLNLMNTRATPTLRDVPFLRSRNTFVLLVLRILSDSARAAELLKGHRSELKPQID